MRIVAIIPALNEADAIGKVVAEIPRDLIDEIIVVDNGSTDATATVARDAGACVVAQPERGYGAASMAGVDAAPDADIYVFMDGDHSDVPARLADLIEPIRRDEADVVLPRQHAADAAIAPRVVDGVDLDAGALGWIVMQMKHPEMTHQPRAEKLADEAFVAIVGPDVAEHAHRVAGPGDIRKPFAILVVRRDDDALDVLHHRKAKRVWIKT